MEEKSHESSEGNVSKKEHKRAKKDIGSKVRKNPWILSTVVLAAVVIVLLFIGNFGGAANKPVSKTDAGNIIVDLAKSQIGDIGVTDVESESGLYKISYSSSQGDGIVYLTEDGENLVNGLIPISQLQQAQENQTATESAQVPTADKPDVELFVMSFCPYGVKAEQNIMPVIDLLGDSIDFKIRYIVNVNGDTINDVQSLHGLSEAKQDAVQLIIKRDYPSKFLTYIENFDNNCYQYAQDDTQLDTCWKSEATKLGINTANVETAAYGSDGVNLLKAEEAEAAKYSVSGSPTLIINGVQSSAIYSGTSATQDAICGAFITPPSACGTQAQAPAGSTTASGTC